MREKLTVIKVGGKIVEEEATLLQLLNDFAAISGHKVLVHGGGRSATKIAAQLGIESKNGKWSSYYRCGNVESGNDGVWWSGKQEYCCRVAGPWSERSWTDWGGYECDPIGKASGERG